MILFLVLAVLLVASVAYIIIFNFIESNKLTSPDGNYKVAYNKFTNTTKFTHEKSGAKTYVSHSDGNPTRPILYSWSPDSRYLALTYTDVKGYTRTEMTDFINNSGFAIPRKSEIQIAYGEMQTNNENANIYVSEWLDNNHALIKFSWESEASGKIISGWFTYKFSPRSIIDLHVNQ